MANKRSCHRVQARRARVAPPRTDFLAFKPRPPPPPRSPTLTHVCVRVRDAGVDARAGIPTVEMPEDAMRHIASFFDGKTARHCASVCRVLARPHTRTWWRELDSSVEIISSSCTTLR